VSSGIDKLIDIIRECFFFFVPMVVLRPYERGVRQRSHPWREGVGLKVLGPGFHWVVPFNVDDVLRDTVTPRTYRIVANLTTLDGRAIKVAIVITARIRDIEKALLEVEDVDTALKDSAHGVLFRYVAARSWDDLRKAQREDEAEGEDGNTGPDELYKPIRKLAFRWGVEVMRVQLSDLATSRTLCVNMENSQHLPTQAAE
jgi:regulator of protease activity HflC (stomatin/prohibitin superfamily)